MIRGKVDVRKRRVLFLDPPDDVIKELEEANWIVVKDAWRMPDRTIKEGDRITVIKDGVWEFLPA